MAEPVDDGSGRTRADLAKLARRVAALEAEVAEVRAEIAECRRLALRVSDPHGRVAYREARVAREAK